MGHATDLRVLQLCLLPCVCRTRDKQTVLGGHTIISRTLLHITIPTAYPEILPWIVCLLSDIPEFGQLMLRSKGTSYTIRITYPNTE